MGLVSLLGLVLAAPDITPARVAELVQLPPTTCPEGSDRERTRCLLDAALGSDPRAAALAVSLYDASGDVVGVLPEEHFPGGYRGVIHLVPVLPVGRRRPHLERVAGALAEVDGFLTELSRRAGRPLDYRWTQLELRFFRSPGRRTPAAFATGWSVAYNIDGSLNGSLAQVRHLLFHEIFHLNDGGWSTRALASDYAAIVRRCGTAPACLAPYVPEPLMVRVKGGTYYSFMPDNGVPEYAADLALRYFKEHREILAGRPVRRPFKCGPPENRRAWTRLAERFFAGVDLVPACR